MSRLPNFIVIGAARSGTTALYEFLRQHPQVFMSRIKEPNYFAFAPGAVTFDGPGAEFVNNSVRNPEEYRELFAAAGTATAVGEASPLYLQSSEAPDRIFDELPKVKLIAILRNPVEQAYSHYLYARAQMIEPLDDFRAALAAQAERRAANWQPLFQYAAFPRYGEQLSRYFKRFEREQIRIFLYEDFESNPQGVLRDIYGFIGVDDSFQNDTARRINKGGVPRSARLQALLMRPNLLSRLAGLLLPERARRLIRDRLSSKNIQRDQMPAEARAFLQEELREDVRLLGSLLGRDLSRWLT